MQGRLKLSRQKVSRFFGQRRLLYPFDSILSGILRYHLLISLDTLEILPLYPLFIQEIPKDILLILRQKCTKSTALLNFQNDVFGHLQHYLLQHILNTFLEHTLYMLRIQQLMINDDDDDTLAKPSTFYCILHSWSSSPMTPFKHLPQSTPLK